MKVQCTHHLPKETVRLFGRMILLILTLTLSSAHTKQRLIFSKLEIRVTKRRAPEN